MGVFHFIQNAHSAPLQSHTRWFPDCDAFTILQARSKEQDLGALSLSTCRGTLGTAQCYMCFALQPASTAGAHSLLLLGVTRQEQRRLLFHTAGWALKVLLWVACIVACFLMPSGVIGVYGQIAKVCVQHFHGPLAPGLRMHTDAIRVST